MVYPEFVSIVDAFKEEFARYMDSDNKYIKFAIEEYFSKIFNDNADCPKITVNCEEKIRSGIQVKSFLKMFFIRRSYC